MYGIGHKEIGIINNGFYIWLTGEWYYYLACLEYIYQGTFKLFCEYKRVLDILDLLNEKMYHENCCVKQKYDHIVYIKFDFCVDWR